MDVIYKLVDSDNLPSYAYTFIRRSDDHKMCAMILELHTFIPSPTVDDSFVLICYFLPSCTKVTTYRRCRGFDQRLCFTADVLAELYFYDIASVTQGQLRNSTNVPNRIRRE